MIEFNATFLVAMFSFVVFIMIMNAIFYRPVLNIMIKRDEYINSNHMQAKDFSDKAEQYTAQREKKLHATQDNCRQKIKDIVEETQELANEKTRAAKEQSKAKIQSKKDILTREEQTLKNTVKSTVVSDLALSITTKLLGAKVEPQSVNYEIVNKIMD